MEALESIVRFTGCDLNEARRFCVSVQRVCKVSPSFSAIAAALVEVGGFPEDIRKLADQASMLQGRADNVLPVETCSTPSPPVDKARSVYEAALSGEGIRSALESMAAALTRQVVGFLIAEKIVGKVIGFTGNGPYDATGLELLATKLGAIADESGIDWGDLEWIVIGSDDIDWEYLENSASVEGIKYFTQEEFIGRVFLGDLGLRESFFNSHNSSHPGIRFIASALGRRGAETMQAGTTSPVSSASSPSSSPMPKPQAPAPPVPLKIPTKPPVAMPTPPPKPAAPPPLAPPKPAAPTPAAAPSNAQPTASPPLKPALPAGWNGLGQPPRSTPAAPLPSGFKWPDPYSTSGHEDHQEGQEPLGLRDESDLKKLGYSVAKGVSLHDRRKVLEYAARNLGLRSVANHLAWLIRFHRNNPTKHDAVERWEEDFEWLRSRYGSRY